MVRKLKFHEQKLLRKTDFISYKSDNDHRDKAVIRRYMIQKPEDYHKYNRICGVCSVPGPDCILSSFHSQLPSSKAQITTA